MPWKFCPSCKHISYSAATHYEKWSCPHCGIDLKLEPEYDIDQARALREQHLPETTDTEPEKPKPSE